MMKKIMILMTVVLGFQWAQAQFSPYIIGGVDEPANSEVAQRTVLLIGKINNRGTFYCTGTILSENMILTAAHCLGGNLWADLIVHFKVSVNGSGTTAKVIDRRAALTSFPSGQDFDWNDVAVVKIEGKIPAGYKPVQLASKNNLANHDVVILAGFGRNIPKFPPNDRDGLGVLRSVEQNVIESNYGKSEILISIKDKGACSGDSGGPAFVRQNNEWLQVGIASRLSSRDLVTGPDGKPNYECSVDLVYSQTAFHSNWIKAAMAEMN